MKELSLNILDVTENSVSAGATEISITLDQAQDGMLTVVIKDNGCGMSPETVKSVIDPFYTTRTTRRVGLGIPLLREAAQQTGGDLKIESQIGQGTVVTAVFDTKSIDCMPLGDIVSTLKTLIMGAPSVDFTYIHSTPTGEVRLLTRELREQLGPDIPLSNSEVISWIGEYLSEQYKELKK